MRINDRHEYAEAIERANRLRGQGHSAEASPELAELDAAIHAYEQLPDQPGTTPGKPAPDPYRN
ncbi:MAG: hypothetical protein U1E66_01325 [Rhodospirillales bacterium]